MASRARRVPTARAIRTPPYNRAGGRGFDEGWGGFLWRHHDIVGHRWLHVARSPGDASTLTIRLEAVAVAVYEHVRKAPLDPFAAKGASQEGHIQARPNQPPKPAQPDFTQVPQP